MNGSRERIEKKWRWRKRNRVTGENSDQTGGTAGREGAVESAQRLGQPRERRDIVGARLAAHGGDDLRAPNSDLEEAGDWCSR
eukprot:4435581-Pleurochrysis_carterae.AAC.6